MERFPKIERESRAFATSEVERPKFDLMDVFARSGNGHAGERYRSKQLIFSQGEVADSIFYIQKGKVKLTVVSKHGKEAVVAVVGKNEFFGEGCLAGRKIRLATATALTDCEVMRLEKDAVALLLHQDPAFSELFIEHLLKRTLRVEGDLVDQLFNSSEKRLARALLLLANFGTDERPEPVIANVTQEMLAEMIGTTRSRVSFFMNKFRKSGFISYKEKIVVHPSLLKFVLHEQPQINLATIPYAPLALSTSRDVKNGAPIMPGWRAAPVNKGAAASPLHPQRRANQRHPQGGETSNHRSSAGR